MTSDLPRGTTSARSLLRTILGHAVQPLGVAPWTHTLVTALGTLGVDRGAARQAVTRTAEAGGLEVAERNGRRVRWRLSPLGARQAAESRDRIYSFEPLRADWDQRWVVLYISIAESDRNRRHLLRRRLTWAGFGSIGAGAWISPHAERAAEAQAILAELGLTDEAAMFIGRHAPAAGQAALIRRAWDLDALAELYERFNSDVRALHPTSPAESFAAVTTLVHQWRHLPLADPGLPLELAPAQWPGPQAKWLFDDRISQWNPAAERWFLDLDRAQ